MNILHQAGFKTTWQAATLAKCHALTIVPCPSLNAEYEEYNLCLWVYNYSFSSFTTQRNLKMSVIFH